MKRPLTLLPLVLLVPVLRAPAAPPAGAPASPPPLHVPFERYSTCGVARCVCPEHLTLATGRIGESPRATHCQRGHPFSPENTYVSRRGWRIASASLSSPSSSRIPIGEWSPNSGSRILARRAASS